MHAVENEVGHRHHEAVWMISLVVEQFRTELRWLDRVGGELQHRARAKNPAIVEREES